MLLPTFLLLFVEYAPCPHPTKGYFGERYPVRGHRTLLRFALAAIQIVRQLRIEELYRKFRQVYDLHLYSFSRQGAQEHIQRYQNLARDKPYHLSSRLIPSRDCPSKNPSRFLQTARPNDDQ